MGVALIMGYGILITCKNCDYSKEFELGIGENYSSLEVVQKQLHYTRRSKVKEILENHDVKGTDYAHELYHCPICHSLYEQFYIKIVYDNNQIYETGFGCSNCGKVLKRLREEDVPKYPCCNCGEFTLKVERSFYWD